MPMLSGRTLMQLAWPIYIDLFLQFLVNNVGQLMIGRYSSQAVAAIGNANQVINVLNIILSTVAMASMILISLRLGANELDRVQSIFTVALTVNIALGVAASVFILVFNQQLFALMNVPSELIADARTYLLSVGSFMWLQGLYLGFLACLKSFSLMRHLLGVSVAMNVVTVLGNLVFLHGFGPIPPMGVAGVAIATNLSKFTAVAILAWLFAKKVPIKFSWKAFTPFPLRTIAKLGRIGLPAGLEDLSYNIAQVTLLAMVNMFGTATVAARVYTGILAVLCYLFASALSQASQVVCAHLAGAGRLDEVDHRSRRTTVVAVSVSFGTTLAIFLASDSILKLFTTDAAVIALVRSVLVVELWLESARTVNVILVRTMQAIGDVDYPLKVGLVSMWLVQVGGAYLLGVVLQMGLVGIWIALASDETVRALLFIRRWSKGTWRSMVGRLSDNPKQAVQHRE
jgi:putative MATE family efflux protein